MGPGGPTEVGGVARFPRLDIVGEKGGSCLKPPAWYWPMPDHSLPSTETGDMVPLRPFMIVGCDVSSVMFFPALSLYPFIQQEYELDMTESFDEDFAEEPKTDSEARSLVIEQ
jgi:hypothetical protein